MKADVLGLYLGIEGTHVSRRVEKLVCNLDGILGDRHKSISKLAGAQEKHIVEKYRPVANFRQITLVSQEEIDVMVQILGIPTLYPEDLSANIVLCNIAEFTQLPPVYYLVFSNLRHETHAVLRMMGENRPCVVAGENMENRYPDQKGIKSRFVKAALGRRGQVAIVYAEGVIRVGDIVEFVSHQPELKRQLA
ncbi:hypothetical protein A2382_04605 [Candidatus Woesebacteria bacterium RIFOXYB1_FULL_38_16]|uniref:MOSC domain-containing protein n=1 Tax=Candidatus Woesebacteria bacterium RIFOXYB1_FULL_38_16 TaxID=1802538 RepID=A0A1F8CUF0_9BACT|nr:MAG: hypothetical protein A2191_03980 [Candidatus Woesebacteria bacterium RIFOXYA1_FULL_38_9]OGM79940.1 MAG: hypothetical protein A2382_04605 [Candidatus Woesebacteria bacterium RIFOXYB1_FULL_38_16]